MQNAGNNEILIQAENKGIDFKKYIFRAISLWYLFLITLPAAYFYAKQQNKFMNSSCTVSTTLLLKEGTNEEAYAGGLRLFNQGKKVSTQKGILNSYSFNKKTLQELDFEISYFTDEEDRSDREIYKNSPFIVNLDSLHDGYINYQKFYITLLSNKKYKLENTNFNINKTLKFGEQFIYQNFNFNIRLKNPKAVNNAVMSKKYYFYKNDMNSLVNSYKARLNIDVRPSGSAILWLWITGNVAEKEADYLNKLAEVFIRHGLETKNSKTQSVIEFIDKQLGSVADSLNRTETNLQIFKQKNKTLSISAGGQTLLESLNELEKKSITHNASLEYYKYINNEFKNISGSFVIPSVVKVDDPVLSTLFVDLSDAVSEKEIIEFDVKKTIPETKILDYKIKKIQDKILNHSQENINAINEEISKIKIKLSDINFRIEQLPASERKIISIERKFNINDAIYTMLLQRRMEAAVTQASNKADIEVLDAAKPRNAAWNLPDRAGNTRKKLILALIIPIVFVVIYESLNNKIQSKGDIEKSTDIPILASIGKNTKDSNIPALAHKNSQISEAFRSLRTNLQYILREKNQKIIVVTSSISGEGKSFVATNLAAIIAISGKKTLLIGLDLRKPKLQNEFHFSNEIGVSTHLINNNSYEEIINKTETENFFVALSGPVPPNPAELIESEQAQKFFERAKKEFDYIIIDTPPIAIVTDALLLLDITDAYLYVIRQKYSKKNVLKLIKEINNNVSLKNLSLIINDVTVSRIYGYGYRYGYGYGRGYGYYEEGQKQDGILISSLKKITDKIIKNYKKIINLIKQ